MNLAHPWVLLFVPLVVWFVHRRLRRKTSVTVASTLLWPKAQPLRARVLWVLPFLRGTCIVLAFVALARPQSQSSVAVEAAEGIAIQLLVDVSSSMDMNAGAFDGTKMSRIEAAKTLVERFIAGDGDRLKGRPHDLIGLISFARYADTRSPLTFGHDALVQIVRQLQIQERPNEDGTAYGDALAIAAARLKTMDELKRGRDSFDPASIASRVIILLTDGENNSGAHLPIEAAGLARQWGCRIYAISLGDPVLESDGNPGGGAALTPAEQVLEQISTATGGIFRQAHDFESLLSVYEEIDRLERSEISTREFEIVGEWFWLPLAAGLCALALALILETTWLRVVP